MKNLITTFLKRSCYLIALTLSFNAYAQVSGVALLAGQANHSGIKVKFIANSGTAVTDSCLTDTSGNFSKNIANGVYKIMYTKPGFHYVYNYNAPAILLTSTSVVPTVTLNTGYAEYVSNTASGTWQDSTSYYVTGDLTIQLNNTLTIPAGTKIIFLGYYKFIAYGALIAKGTSSERIIFTAKDTTVTWDLIGPNNNSILDFCLIEYGYNGISSTNSNPVISNCIIRNINHTAISALNGAPKFLNNEIYNFGYDGISTASSEATLSCNHIHDGRYQNPNGNSKAVRISGGECLVENNHIHNTLCGIDINKGSLNVKNNYIWDNMYGMMIDNPAYPVTNLNVINNTLTRNETSIYFYNTSPNTNVINNCITDATSGIINANSTIDHNLLYKCNFPFTNTQLIGLGQLVTKNNNGDSIDSYFNLLIDPEFVVGQEPWFQGGSPVYNAGNAQRGPHIGADPNLICMSNRTTGILTYQKENVKIKLFPNPNNGVFNVELVNNSELSIYTMLGKIVYHENSKAGKQQIDISNYESGIYFIKVKDKVGEYTSKFIKE